jgi:hypothetical protein
MLVTGYSMQIISHDFVKRAQYIKPRGCIQFQSVFVRCDGLCLTGPNRASRTHLYTHTLKSRTGTKVPVQQTSLAVDYHQMRRVYRITCPTPDPQAVHSSHTHDIAHNARPICAPKAQP